jgi:sterol desaturase/sphingolipid hydroxylase (fatty acid hydroxylase superfamily)
MFVFFWSYGGSLLYFVDMKRNPEWIYRTRFQPKRPFSIDKTAYNQSLTDCITRVLFNQFFVILPGLLLIDHLCTFGYLGPYITGVEMSPRLPPLTSMLSSAVKAVALVEIGFFYSHWLFHQNSISILGHKMNIPFYTKIHKIHHDFKAPYGICAIYAHWIEALVGNTFCIMGPAFFVNSHAVVWYIGMVVGWFSTVTSHSGYGLPGHKKSNKHDLHHELFKCNYGTLGVLDWLHGTAVARPPKEGWVD